MLVLTRKVGETIHIGHNIVVKVISVDGDQVKIGIEAPKSIQVHRKEVYESIQKENEQALNINDSIMDDLNDFK